MREALKNLQRPRVSIFRTARHIYGQVIDDAVGKTLVSCSTIRSGTSFLVTKNLSLMLLVLNLLKRVAKKALMQVVFDRGPFFVPWARKVILLTECDLKDLIFNNK